jgi:glycosyltransferase involved in cell wall biosynthesis
VQTPPTSTRTGAPLVTIVVATYNYGRFLARALDSALAQDYPEDALEIVVVDDGSTDGTPQVVEPYLDRVRYIRKENGGLLSTVNRGLSEAQGEFIALLSADDEYLPHKTRAQVDFLGAHPEVGMVYADLEVVDDEGATLHASLWENANITPVRGRAFGALLDRNVVSGGAMMFRSSLKPVFHPIPATAAWEDWYIALRISAVAEIDYIPEPVYRYRFHGQNMNLGATGDKMAGLLREELRFRRSMLAELAPGLVGVPELIAAWAAMKRTAMGLVQITGTTVEALVPVSDEQRARASEAVAAARAAGGGDRPVFLLVNALAEDPSNADAQADLVAALQARAPEVPAPSVDGARSFATLAHAAELVAVPDTIAAYAGCFSGADDATLVVVGAPHEIEALGQALERLGLADDDGPDVLAVTDRQPQELAGSVHAVYSRHVQEGALASRPRIDDSRPGVLRDLAKRAALVTAPGRPQRS